MLNNEPNTGSGHPTEGSEDSKTLAEQSSKGPASSSPVQTMAKEYIKRKKAEQIRELKSKHESKLLSYEALNASIRKRISAPYLQSGDGIEVEDNLLADGDFFSTADSRTSLMTLDSCLERKANTSFSFDPWRKVCISCHEAGTHSVLGKDKSNWKHEPVREAIILCDQSYPPILPSSSSLQCLRIIRLEFGSIFDLTTTILERLEGRQLTLGSVILIFSATHLAQVGLSAYIDDIVSARRKIQAALGEAIHVTAAPPLLLCGTENCELIKCIFGLQGWASSVLNEDICFNEAHNLALETILENGSGGAQLTSNTRVRLPGTFTGFEYKKIWIVGSNSNLPNKSGGASESQETAVIRTLIGELQLKLALELDATPTMSRTPSLVGNPRGAAKDGAFLIIGSSNAGRLEEALQRKGVSTGHILSKNWRATKTNVADMANQIQEELSVREYTVVVFQLLDNNIFFALCEDGSRIPARRGLDGKFHVDGALVLADKDNQYAILKLCEPLWSATKNKHVVVVGPLPRFISNGCCADSEHVSNRTDLDYYVRMKEDLSKCCGNIKDFFFTSAHRNCRVMDKNMAGLAAAEIWGSDPVHPKPEIYDKLAEGVIAVEKFCGSG